MQIMDGIERIFKAAEWSQRFQYSWGLNSQISEIIRTHERITKSISGASMIAEIAKGMQHHTMYKNPSLSAIESIINSHNLQTRLIPQTTIDAISSIGRQHEQVFGRIRTLTETLSIQSPAIAQINNLHLALNGISGKIAAFAALHKDWAIINDFEEVTEHALEFTEAFSEEITEEQQRQFRVLLTLVSLFFSKHKTLGIYGLLVIDILIRCADLHQYYDFLVDKPEPPTKYEVNQIGIRQDSTIHLIHAINEQLKQANAYIVTNRACKVKLKPKAKTITLADLPTGFTVIVIQIHHKWVYVSFFDPKDDLPQTGWILKKYLNKP